MRLSAQGYFRVPRVARTQADLDSGRAVRQPHVAEVLSYWAVLSPYDMLSV